MEGSVATEDENALPSGGGGVTRLRGEIVLIRRNANLELPAAAIGELPQSGEDFRGTAAPRGGVHEKQVWCVRKGVRGRLHRSAMLTEAWPSVNSCLEN